ncbi:MAG: uroporphyrinogen-III C-methyltransferase [Synergistaceae bacterium]|jgi:uroporphyrinogen III methyltransferase/synthase|nr:uroporphyrinogen-III C-methyltransferase [Synergistaceae bacterium]
MSVILAGAGCGSPRLLTIAARDCISRADHIVYDRLIHPDILQLAPSGCVFHAVGKRESRHTMPQREINELLIKLGRGGGTVVRLKGGDPFVFGRGGEEAMALESAGLDWSAVPGVSSALGGASSVGLPVTHRDSSSSVSLLAAHRRHDRGDGVSEPELRRIMESGTGALYMGASSFSKLSARLLEMGKSPDTAVTVVVWGGWGRARRLDGTLLEMNGISKSSGLPAPAVIYLGGTAGINLLPHRGPLAGLQIAVCRPYPECWDTGRALEELGADCYGLPLLSLVPIEPDGSEKTAQAMQTIRDADWLVLTSPRGPAELKRVVRDMRLISGKVAAIGEGTAAALRRIGIEPDLVAAGNSRDLASLLREAVKPGESVVFARNERASDASEEAARAAGASVKSVHTYRMMPRDVPGLDIMREQWESCGLDAIIFGSSAMAEAYSGTIGRDFGARLIAWGAPCAETVERVLGRKPLVLPAPDMDGLLSVLRRLRDA